MSIFKIKVLHITYFWNLSGTCSSALAGFCLFWDFFWFLADFGFAPLLLLGKVKRSLRWSGLVTLLYTIPAKENINTVIFLFIWYFSFLLPKHILVNFYSYMQSNVIVHKRPMGFNNHLSIQHSKEFIELHTSTCFQDCA